MIYNSFKICIVLLSIILVSVPNANGQSESNKELYDIEGTVMLPNLTTSWLAETVIQLKGGEAVGFLRYKYFVVLYNYPFTFQIMWV